MSAVGLRAVRTRPAQVAVLVLGAWFGGWGLFYALQEWRRCVTLRRRNQRHRLRKRGAETDQEWFGQADAHERQDIAKRFGSLKFGGRYLNVTPEWREQGMWEWLCWKVPSTFLLSRINWDGGLAEDRRTEEGLKRILATLPVQPLDTQYLWGSDRVSPAKAAAPPEGITYTW